MREPEGGWPPLPSYEETVTVTVTVTIPADIVEVWKRINADEGDPEGLVWDAEAFVQTQIDNGIDNYWDIAGEEGWR